MIDLTTNPQDKDTFITKVYMKEEEPYFYIQYASGREEQKDFSIHNLNASFIAMERQFYQYKNDYLSRISNIRFKANLLKLIEGLFAIGSIYLTTSMPFPIELKLIIDLIIIVVSLYFQKVQSIKSAICTTSETVVFTAEEFLNNKEQFLIKVTDPKKGTEEDWYLVTLSEIEEFQNSQQLRLIGHSLTPEIKEEETQRTNKVLRKIFLKEGEENA